MNNQYNHRIASKGFALVVTVSLLVLLSVIALGLLSLSTVTLRSGTQEQAQTEARANARLALQIAIGELQKQLGPDQRISANGAILSESAVSHPHWNGVWDSWIAGPKATAAVKADYPSAESHHQTIGSQPDASMRPEYEQKDEHFRSWLVSLAPNEAGNMVSARDLVLNGKPIPTKDDQAIQLVGKGSLGDAANTTDFVTARLINVSSSSAQGAGRYAWWVGDESQKARVMHDSYDSTPPANNAEKIYRGQSPGSTGTKMIKDLEDITIAQEARLKSMPTQNTLDLVVDTNATGKQPSKKNYHSITAFSQSVLADVREGGLKRDLSVILERPINESETSDEFMLYRFDDQGEARVPIQDLAAYYQLYQDDPTWAGGRRGGVKYTSTPLANSIQVTSPDYGTPATRNQYLRQYTALYTNPVPIKVQFLLAFGATPITDEDKTYITGRNLIIRPSDTHKLLLGVIPVITLWNPNNTPLAMNANANVSQVFKMSAPPIALELRKYRADGSIHNNGTYNLNFAFGGGGDSDGRAARLYPHIIQLRFANTRPIVFEPGEVKIFSLPASAGGKLSANGGAFRSTGESEALYLHEPVNAWDPFGFFVAHHSARASEGNATTPGDAYRCAPGGGRWHMFFGANDSITTRVLTESTATAGQMIARMSETRGAGFQFYLMDYNHARMGSGTLHFRNYQFMSRFGGPTGLGGAGGNEVFNAALMTPGFPGGVAPIPFDAAANSIPGSQLIGAVGSDEAIAFLEFSMAAGCETSSSAVGGFSGGRRITSRPFQHGSIIAAPFLDQADRASQYDYGWDWQVGKINNVEDSIIQGEPGTGRSHFGGGYTLEAGATHVVQQDLPVLPPISIASLSHAHLGGFSLGNAPSVSTATANEDNWRYNGIPSPWVPGDFHRVTATGQGGLAPHIMQAIGNSYAHPNIPADKAQITKSRFFNLLFGAQDVPYVDHSYLANKALWDKFFFSSMSPQPAKVELFGGTERTAKNVADDFFFGDGTKPLPNRRITHYKNNFDQVKLDTLFTQSGAFTNGLADKIAAHLMVDGAFNVNSTSLEAWKVLFSSLRGKPVAHYQSGKTPLESVSSDKTPVNPGMLPNAKPVASSDISSPNEPADQWRAGRELTDAEITQLATAMVRQVKLRGPFLSMSEFINRRLDASNTGGMALKGALQAALDDPDVSINAQFRTPNTNRMLDGEVTGIPFAFLDAAKGPIAYGSQPYVDQADVLRGFAEQLTPRGDTFVIRTYGDSLDASGRVVARAWCEAVVQRIPDYVDPQDDNHIRTADLQSESNRKFGRSLNIISFRWLHPNEV